MTLPRIIVGQKNCKVFNCNETSRQNFSYLKMSNEIQDNAPQSQNFSPAVCELIIDVQFGAAPYIGASVPTLAYSPYLAATAGLAVSPLLGNDQTQLLNHGAGQPQHQHAGQTAPDQQQLQQQSKQRNDRIEVSSF